MFKLYKNCCKALFFTLILFAKFSFSFAQITETHFYDSITKIGEGRIFSGIADGPYMYISGSSFSETVPIPTVTKVDTAGHVIWTATTHDNNEFFTVGGVGSCRSIFKSGNRVYTIAQAPYWNPTSRRIEVWCISDTTGEVLWRSGFNEPGIKIVDYSATELILLAGETNSSDTLKYRILDKATGAVLYYKGVSRPEYMFWRNQPDIIVDAQQNILISVNDTCKKFRDKYLNQLQWNSRIHPSGFDKMVDKIMQDSGRYILIGNSYVRAVDSATGNTIWYRDVPVGRMIPYQQGASGRPKDVIIKDSLVYVSWVSPFVGSVDLLRGFTVTKINTRLGTISLNVAYDFNGVPPDAVAQDEDLDWPMAMTLDANQNIYLAGSYDYSSGPETPSNWGIMKINGQTGAFIFESTITLDPGQRMRASQGRFLHYYNGRMYCAGNAQKNRNTFNTTPLLVAFDTTATYTERFRISPEYGYRFSSSLAGLTAFGNQQMALLKSVGQSSVVELRDLNNQLIWSKSFSSSGKFVVPQNFKNLGDTSVAASFIIHTMDNTKPTFKGNPDSILFVRLDINGIIAFQRRLLISSGDTVAPFQIYSDNAGKANFIYYRKPTGSNFFEDRGLTVNGTATTMGITGYGEIRNFKDIPKLRMNKFQQYNLDTMVFYHSDEIGMPSRNQGLLYSTTQTGAGTYNYFGFKTIRDFIKINSVIKLDSASFFITGKSETGTIIGARFNRKLANPWVWSSSLTLAGNMLNADTSATSIYCVSERTGNVLYLSKLNKLTGNQVWSYERNPLANRSINTLDFKYNNIAQNFTAGGYIYDSTSENTVNTYFYITLDSSGNIIKDITRLGASIGETRINTIEVLQNGSNAYGGSLATNDFGTVGFYNADCSGANITPSVSITTPVTSICTGTTVTFTATPVNGGTAPVYQWQVNGGNVGTNSSTFTTSTLNNNDQVKVILTSNADCLATPTDTSNIITITVTAAVTPGVNVTADQTNICAGTLVTFTATPTNGGSTPTYQWQVNGTNAGTNSNVFTTSTLNNNDQVKVLLTSSLSCASPTNVTSNTITMIVTPAPIANAGNDAAICAGASVQLQGSGGTTYSWSPAAGLSNPNIANPIATPAITTAYILTVSNGGSCNAKDTVVITVSPVISSSVSITVLNNNICSGTLVTFTATPVNGGATPVYQWQVNGVNAGTNSNTFNTSALTNNAQVKVILTSSLNCVSPATATSNIITMSVTPMPIANAGNDVNICIGGSIQLQASGGISYSWSPVAGLSNPNIANPVASPAITTQYVVTVSNSISCFAKDTVVVSVGPAAPAAVSITTASNNICYGTSATFFATPVNGGSNPVYQWQVDGVNVGTNSNIFTSTTLTHNSQVKVLLTSNSSCVTTPNAVSNIITMNVDQLATPLVSVNNRIFTVTNPDVAALYTWQIRNNNVWANVIPVATGITYTAPAAGEYRVRVVKGVCTRYSASTVTNVTSTLSHFIYVHPNPASRFVTFDSINLSKKYETIQIIDMQGRQVMPLINVKNQVAITIDINLLTRGMYMAIFRQWDETYTVVRFIKQ